MHRPGGDLEPLQGTAGISLLFAVDARPTASDLERLLAAPARSGRTARISHRPPDDQGWLELLASGLTYDLRGLAPSDAAPVPPPAQLYGLPADMEKFELEAIALEPGEHIAAGGPLLPVVRILLGLAAGLALELPVAAVCWNPAQSWMDPKYFGRIVLTWLSGGVFPALGLTCLQPGADAALESSGLAFFTGQEIHVPHHAGEPGSDTMRIAARAIDHLVRNGPLERAEALPGTSGELVMLEPSPDGRQVVVARSA
ncbi:MAG: hypothetical protein JF595_04230 [Sphingomonadales bacterium]|nr:hypothetical protein [Sphingomonadales bacterium]